MSDGPASNITAVLATMLELRLGDAHTLACAVLMPHKLLHLDLLDALSKSGHMQRSLVNVLCEVSFNQNPIEQLRQMTPVLNRNPKIMASLADRSDLNTISLSALVDLVLSCDSLELAAMKRVLQGESLALAVQDEKRDQKARG